MIDVVFKEEASQGDSGYPAENMDLIRGLAGNMIKIFDPKCGANPACKSVYQIIFIKRPWKNSGYGKRTLV